jgi:hypothetical protein
VSNARTDADSPRIPRSSPRSPVTGERGELRGIVGLSASTRAFDAEHDELAAAVLGVAAEASPLAAVA